MPELYLYRYICQRWWGPVSDIQLAQVPDSPEPLRILLRHAEAITGSKTCSIDLLQKFQLSMSVSETYGAMATLPVTAVEDHAS